jgi:GcrA cell cycle regulator
MAVILSLVGMFSRILRMTKTKPQPRFIGPRVPVQFPERNCCVYPFGDPGSPDFHWCGAPVRDQGESYCRDHHALVYQPLSQARLS